MQAITVELRSTVSDIDEFYGVKDDTSLLRLYVEHSGDVRLLYCIKWLSDDSQAHKEYVNTGEFESKHDIKWYCIQRVQKVPTNFTENTVKLTKKTRSFQLFESR